MLRYFKNQKYWGSSSVPPCSQFSFFFLKKRQGCVSKATCELRCSTPCLPHWFLLQQHHAWGNPGLQWDRVTPAALSLWDKREQGPTALHWAAQEDFSLNNMLKGRSPLLLEMRPNPWLTPRSAPLSASKCTFWYITLHFHPRQSQAAPLRWETGSLCRLGGPG